MSRATRTLAAITAATALTLAACGSDDQPPQATSTPSLETTPPTQAAQVGDTLKIRCADYNPCDADLHLTEATLNDQCQFGDYGYPEFALKDGELNLHISAEFSVSSVQGNDWTMAPDPEIVDSAGFTKTVGVSAFCESDRQRSGWADPVDVGEKKLLYDAYVVPADAKILKLGEYKIELAPAASTTDPVEQAPEPTPPAAPEPIAPAPVEEEAVPLSDVPYANGGTCPAYLCGYGTDENGNPNPSSGELQLQHGCEQGYIQDPDQCAAVGVPVTDQ